MSEKVIYPLVIRRKNGENFEIHSKQEYNIYIKNLIIKADLKVLRDKSSGMALGVSYTEDGLKTIANKSGRYLYFRNVTNIKDIPKGIKNNRVIVEKFVPKTFDEKTFNSKQLNKAEIHHMEAAKFKIYNSY